MLDYAVISNYVSALDASIKIQKRDFVKAPEKLGWDMLTRLLQLWQDWGSQPDMMAAAASRQICSCLTATRSWQRSWSPATSQNASALAVCTASGLVARHAPGKASSAILAICCRQHAPDQSVHPNHFAGEIGWKLVSKYSFHLLPEKCMLYPCRGD